MIYDNCIKYIDKELKRNLIDKEWKQKKIFNIWIGFFR